MSSFSSSSTQVPLLFDEAWYESTTVEAIAKISPFLKGLSEPQNEQKLITKLFQWCIIPRVSDSWEAWMYAIDKVLDVFDPFVLYLDNSMWIFDIQQPKGSYFVDSAIQCVNPLWVCFAIECFIEARAQTIAAQLIKRLFDLILKTSRRDIINAPNAVGHNFVT